MWEQPFIDVLHIWNQGVELYRNSEWRKSISKFNEIKVKLSRHFYNIACCEIELGEVDKAIETLTTALTKDNHSVICLMQRAICYFNLKRYQSALVDLEEALRLVGNRSYVSYKQIGLDHKISDVQIMYNLAAVSSWADDWSSSSFWLTEAEQKNSKFMTSLLTESRVKTKEKEKFLPLTLPRSAIFLPDRSMLDNAARKNYLGQANVISEVKDDAAVRVSRLEIPDSDRRRSRSNEENRSDTANDVTVRTNHVTDSRVIKISHSKIKELHKEMPKKPPPRFAPNSPKAQPLGFESPKRQPLGSEVPKVQPYVQISKNGQNSGEKVETVDELIGKEIFNKLRAKFS